MVNLYVILVLACIALYVAFKVLCQRHALSAYYGASLWVQSAVVVGEERSEGSLSFPAALLEASRVESVNSTEAIAV